MNEVIIGLGSNIDAVKNIEKAKIILKNEIGSIKSSRFIETKPIGYKNQNNFLNGAVLLFTNMALSKLTEKLKRIESSMGREKSFHKYGPRIIDLDILVWNNEIVDKDVFKRKFLKESILELKPNLDLV